MAKRKIEIDGEVRLVSFSEWLKHQNTPKQSQSKKPKIKDIQVESDPVELESIEQDQHNSEE